MFLTKDEIVEDVMIRHLSTQDKQALKQYEKEDLTFLHHDLGQWIRNHYNLWDENHPLTMLNYVPQIVDGCDINPRHPDMVSMDIIVTIWKHLQ